jgi:hypothetical protein
MDLGFDLELARQVLFFPFPATSPVPHRILSVALKVKIKNTVVAKCQ